MSGVRVISIGLVVVGMCLALVYAEPKSPAVREATAAHDAALKQVADAYAKAVVDADAAYVAALKAALLKAAEIQDTDEVVAISELIKGQEPLAPPAAQGQGVAGPDTKNDLFSAPDAKRVVYLCDASGSMQLSFAALRRAIKNSVDQLKPNQQFNVVFFSGDNVVSFGKAAMLQPTADTKKKLSDWIDNIAPKEGTRPIQAIQKAFSLGPDTIFVLTDGFDQGSELKEIVKEFARLNPQKKVKVNTILLTSDVLAHDALFNLLDQIATENGGKCRVVNREEFVKAEKPAGKGKSIFSPP